MRKDTEQITKKRAISEVMGYIRADIKEFEKRLLDPPMAGWSEERHREYYLDRMKEAGQGLNYLHLMLMRINPD